MNPLRSVGGTLALALFLVVAGAMAIVYVVVVPSYQRSLVAARMADLQGTLKSVMELPRPAGASLNELWVEDEAAALANARVVVFRSGSQGLVPVADSSRVGSHAFVDDPVAERALDHHGPVHGQVVRGANHYAEAAQAAPSLGRVVLLSSSLHNDLESVEVVRRRVVVAGVLGTTFAILLGYALATLFARRIRRLERAADRIADGHFDQPVVDRGLDELGELARAFDRMRLTLASLDRARRDFIANASHELRTPLFSMGGFLELLAGEELDARTRAEFVQETREQVERLQKLATDLLDLSRLDAGRLAVASESFDLAAVGELLAGEFRPQAAALRHTLRDELPGETPAIGDEERVLQVGRVLVHNALAHTPAGTTVTIIVTRDNDEVRLVVEDDGPGIPDAEQPLVFDRFFRREGTTASGSGLGLAIARELAELMDARLELRSRPGATRFTLVLHADGLAVTPPRGGSRRIAKV